MRASASSIPHRCRRLAVPLCLVAMVTGACGTRVENGSSAAPAGQTYAQAPTAAQVPGAPAAAGGAGTATSPVTGIAPPAAPAPVVAANSVGSVAASSPVPSKSSSSAAPGTGRLDKGAAAGTAASGETNHAIASKDGDSKPGAVPTPAAPATGPKSPVILASIGNYGGVPGPTLQPILRGAQVWVQSINARGGLNGHPVKLLALDDGSDVARHRAMVQDAVERQHAVAFLSESAPLTGAGSLEYVKEKRIPVIGTEGGSYWMYQHPMYFPQMTSGLPAFWTVIAGAAQQMLPAGKKAVGVIYCSETPQCPENAKLWEDAAPQVGLKFVFKGQASLAQPDFTALCLAARNAGTEALLFSMDGASIRRFAASCARQGYNPLYASLAGIVFDDFKKDPNLQTMIGASPIVPYFRTDSPAVQEYLEAVKRFGGSDLTGIGPLTGWTSGKLLEHAARNLPEPPTNQAILDGLSSLKNDDLDGLSIPQTFIAGQPAAPKVVCWWNVKVQNQTWASPDNYQRHCQ